MATHSKLFQNARAIFFGLTLFSAAPAQSALVNASSGITLSNLQISFLNPAPGTDPALIWTDTWYGTVQASAQQTGYVPDGYFYELLANDGSIPVVPVDAKSGQVKAAAEYGVASAQPIQGAAQSSLTLNAPFQQGDGAAITTFDNFFSVVNQNDFSDNSPIDVLINLDYIGHLKATADQFGYFSVALSALLALELPFEDTFIKLGTASINDSFSGSNPPIDNPYQGTLTIPYTLNYNTAYWLYAEADSEVYGATVPEPDTLLLVSIGLGVIFWRRSKRADLAISHLAITGNLFSARR